MTSRRPRGKTPDVLGPRHAMKVLKTRPLRPTVAKRQRARVTYSSAPEGYVYVALGTPDLAERCKELSREKHLSWSIVNARPSSEVVKNPGKISYHLQRIGYHFVSDIVEQACDELKYVICDDNFVTEAELQQHQHNVTVAQAMQRMGFEATKPAESAEKISAVITELFPCIPEKDRQRVIEHAFNPGSDRIGSAINQPLARRVQLGVAANIRHNYTDYDQLLKAFGYQYARENVEDESLRKIIEWRGEVASDEEYEPDALDPDEAAVNIDSHAASQAAIGHARPSGSSASDDAPRRDKRDDMHGANRNSTSHLPHPDYLKRAFGPPIEIAKRIRAEACNGTLPPEVVDKNGTVWRNKVGQVGQGPMLHSPVPFDKPPPSWQIPSEDPTRDLPTERTWRPVPGTLGPNPPRTGQSMYIPDLRQRQAEDSRNISELVFTVPVDEHGGRQRMSQAWRHEDLPPSVQKQVAQHPRQGLRDQYHEAERKLETPGHYYSTAAPPQYSPEYSDTHRPGRQTSPASTYTSVNRYAPGTDTKPLVQYEQAQHNAYLAPQAQRSNPAQYQSGYDSAPSQHTGMQQLPAYPRQDRQPVATAYSSYAQGPAVYTSYSQYNGQPTAPAYSVYPQHDRQSASAYLAPLQHDRQSAPAYPAPLQHDKQSAPAYPTPQHNRQSSIPAYSQYSPPTHSAYPPADSYQHDYYRQ